MIPRSDEGNRPRSPVVVLNVFATGLAIARSLGRRGVAVIGVSHRSDAPGAWSRHCRHVEGPDSASSPAALLDFLRRLAGELPARPLLLPTRDADVLFVAEHRDTLSADYVLPGPDGETLNRTMDKDLLATAAAGAGAAPPASRRVESADELSKALRDVPLPAVLKPVYSNDWRAPEVWAAVGRTKGIRVDTAPQAMATYRRIAPHCGRLLVQEWIPGEEWEFYILGAYIGRDGTCLGSFTAQKILQYPPVFGLGCLVRLSEGGGVAERGLELLRALDYRGIAEVEFKRDSRTGQLRLIEINPRHWDQHALGNAAGVDLTWLMYRDLCEGGADRETPARRRAWWVGGGHLARGLGHAVARGDWSTVRRSLGVVAGRRVYSLWDPSDPRPFWAALTGRRPSPGRRDPSEQGAVR